MMGCQGHQVISMSNRKYDIIKMRGGGGGVDHVKMKETSFLELL